MRFDPKKRTEPLTDVELNYSPEEWAEALAEDPSCIRAYLEAAEERGRRSADDLLREAREVVRWAAGGGVACLGNRAAAEALLARIDAALAPRASGKET